MHFLKNSRSAKRLLLATFALCPNAGQSQTTLVDNLGRPDIGGVAFSGTGDAFANAFVPAKEAYLKSVTVTLENFENGSGSSAELRLWTGDANLPTTELQNLGQVSFLGAAPENVQFSAPTRARLQANKRYWISVHHVSGDFDWRLSSSGTPFGAAFGTHLGELASSTNDGASWSDGDGPGQQEFAKMAVLADEHLVTNVNDSGEGSLRAAIAAIATGGTVTFDPSLSGKTIELKSQLRLRKSMTIDGAGLVDSITLSKRGVFISSSASVTLRSLIFSGITEDTADFEGASPITNHGQLRMENCTLDQNFGIHAGAIWHLGLAGSLHLENCTLTRNSSDSVGAILIFGHATILNSTIIGNTVPDSGNGSPQVGGVKSSGGITRLENTIIAENRFGSTPADLTVHRESDLVQTNCLIGFTPHLAPLGDYGGPTPTMPPLPGSPAIDAGAATTLTRDQRGFSRVSGSAPDIGAVELREVLVNTTNDEDFGPTTSLDCTISLREAIKYPQLGGEIVRFAPNLSGAKIALTMGMPLSVNRSMTLDGSTLAKSVTISGDADLSGTLSAPDTQTVFAIDPPEASTEVRLDSLIVTGGNADGAASATGGSGGGLYQEGGTLTLNRLTVHGNRANNVGGGVYSEANLVVTNSSIVDNQSDQSGGGLHLSSGAQLSLDHATITGNSAANHNGGVHCLANAFLATNTIIAGNTASLHPNSQVIPTGSHNLLEGDPALAALGDHGGPLPTRPPMYGSPAIDAGTPGLEVTDQRGFPRIAGAAADIGATELTEIVVDTLLDEDNGIGHGDISLREAVAHTAPGEAAIVRFDASLSGGTIPLGGTQIEILREVFIDGSTLPRMITIDALGGSRVLRIAAEHVHLDSLRITGGQVESDDPSSLHGGGVYIDAPPQNSTRLTRCQLENNHTVLGVGGALYFKGSAVAGAQPKLVVDQSTFAHNSSLAVGGALYVEEGREVRILRSTFFGNRAAEIPGIRLFSQASERPIYFMEHCTVTGNHSVNGTSSQAALGVSDQPIVFVKNSIIAGNEPKDGSQTSGDVRITGIVTPSSLVAGDPGLAPLGDYGGPTKTMPPLPGSPAIDMGEASSFTSDQRGKTLPFLNAPDAGAVESQGFQDLELFFSLDFDGDGSPYGLERAIGTDPLVPDADNANHLDFRAEAPSGHPEFTFNVGAEAFADSVWIVKQSTTGLDPADFKEVFRFDSFNGSEAASHIQFRQEGSTIIVTDVSNPPHERSFFKLVVELLPTF